MVKSKSSKVYVCNDEEFAEIIATSASYSECLRKIGLSPQGGNSVDALKRRIGEPNLSTSHFHRPRSSLRIRNNLVDILVADSTFVNATHLKNRLIAEDILPNHCDICGIQTWLDKPIALQLHHKNGVKTDNRLENLQILCPNCHSQTDNYCSKNMHYTPKAKPAKEKTPIVHKRKFEVLKEELEYLICNFSMLTIAKKFGVSDAAIRKRCKFYGLPYKRKDIIEFKQSYRGVV